MHVEFNNGARFDIYSAGPDPIFPDTIAINFKTQDMALVLPVLADPENLTRIVWSDERQEVAYEGYTRVSTVLLSDGGNVQAWLSMGGAA